MQHLLSIQHTKTHAHTHATCPSWCGLMHKLQWSDSFGWVSEPEGSLCKKLWEDFYSCSKPTTESFLRSAALCCPLRKLQLNSLSCPICPLFSQPLGQTDSPHEDIHALALQPFVQNTLPAQSWEWESLVKALQNHNKKKTLARGINITHIPTYTHFNGSQPTGVGLR